MILSASPSNSQLNILDTASAQIFQILEGFGQALPQIIIALIVLALTGLVVRVSRWLLRPLLGRLRLRPSLLSLLLTLSGIGLWLLGFLVASTIVFPSVTPARLLTALGIGSLAVGLAFKDIFENFLAGVMIMLRKPMRIGDFIHCEGIEGTVEEITVRDTYLRQTDDQLVMLPNAFLFKNPVIIRTDKEARRFSLVCGVAYGTDLDVARTVLIQAVDAVEELDKSRPIDVFASEFSASSIDFTIRWWAGSTPLDFHKSYDAVLRAVKTALEEAQIEIPFPQRTIHVRPPAQSTSSE